MTAAADEGGDTAGNKSSNKRDYWAWVVNGITVIASIALIGSGIKVGLEDKTAAAATFLGIGFLCLILLLLAKFKRFKGFGFEAEMWEEKQKQAESIINKLNKITAALAEQTALVVSKLGLWDSGLSFVEMSELLDRMSRVMDAAAIAKKEQKKALQKIYERIERDHWFEAKKKADIAIQAEIDRKLAANEDVTQATQRKTNMQKKLEKLRGIGMTEKIGKGALKPLQDLVNGDKVLKERIGKTIDEIADSLEKFRSTRIIQPPMLGD